MSQVETDIVSALPQMTTDIMAKTGLDERKLSDLVNRFFDRVRRDAVLDPIFAERFDNRGPHLERMVVFWSSVALMTDRYHRAAMSAHACYRRCRKDRMLAPYGRGGCEAAGNSVRYIS